MISAKGISPACLHCGTVSVLISIRGKNRYACQACPDSYVGCHKGGSAPLGYPCDEATRRARGAAHMVLDAIWREAPTAAKGVRRRCYAYLSHALEIEPSKTHIGMFDADTCYRAVAALRNQTWETIWNWFEVSKVAPHQHRRQIGLVQ